MTETSVTVVLERDAAVRLDKYCAVSCGMTRSRLKNGLISLSVNGFPAKLSKMVKSGDVVSFRWEDPAPTDIAPEDIPLDVVFEDRNVTVINKTPGMVCHPAAGNWTGTLVNALLFHWGGGVPTVGLGLRPGIVHRLDKDTSGVMITARNPETELFLQTEFKSRRVKKIYAAVLCGSLREKKGCVETYIARDPKDRLRFVCTSDQSRGKYAKTAYTVVKEFAIGGAFFSFVLFRIYTGRTHQIRVHSRFLGCPVLGDPLYGKKNKTFPSAPLMLHSLCLKIRLPGCETPSVFRAPFPPGFKEILKALGETSDTRYVYGRDGRTGTKARGVEK